MTIRAASKPPHLRLGLGAGLLAGQSCRVLMPLYSFTAGPKCSSEDVAVTIDLKSAKRRGGNWSTGYSFQRGSWFIFGNVGSRRDRAHSQQPVRRRPPPLVGWNPKLSQQCFEQDYGARQFHERLEVLGIGLRPSSGACIVGVAAPPGTASGCDLFPRTPVPSASLLG